MPRQTTSFTIPATIILNPVSGTTSAKDKRTLVKKLAKEIGWTGAYEETTKQTSALQIARAAVAKGVKHLVICGGDGTVMEVLEAVLQKKVTIGIVPFGTGNILARNLDLPLSTEEALQIALVGNPHPIDIGRANGTLFSILAGMGLDAQVMQQTTREMKDKVGFLAYAITMVKNIPRPATPFEIQIDAKPRFTVKAKTVMAANLGKIMGGVEIVPNTHPQSGTLQLGIVKATTIGEWVSLLLHALAGKMTDSSQYERYEGEKMTITSLSRPQAYQCDGNHFPPTKTLTLDLFPKAVTVMVKPHVVSVEQNKKKDVLLFDFDGTLADSLQMVVSIYNELSKKYHYPVLTEKEIQRLRGVSAREILTQLPISKVTLPFLLADGKKMLNQQFENITPFPSIPQVLSTLSHTYTLGIVTSNDPILVKKFLVKQKMDYVDFVYSDGSLFGKGKIIKDVLKKYAFSPRHVKYIGDEVRDIEAARAAGVKVVSVTWGFNNEALLQAHQPDYLIQTPKELATLPSARS